MTLQHLQSQKLKKSQSQRAFAVACSSPITPENVISIGEKRISQRMSFRPERSASARKRHFDRSEAQWRNPLLYLSSRTTTSSLCRCLFFANHPRKRHFDRREAYQPENVISIGVKRICQKTSFSTEAKRSGKIRFSTPDLSHRHPATTQSWLLYPMPASTPRI
jgi:hypothetical protein